MGTGDILLFVTESNLMIDHGVGVTRATSYEVKRLDSDYFEES
jgi:restriction endonuclease Mrr